jgi:hypothetical protein
LGQASQLAGLHQIQIQRELAKRDIPIHYGEREFWRDMETINGLQVGSYNRSNPLARSPLMSFRSPVQR